MLAISFFSLIFGSLVWLIFSIRFVLDSLGSTAFFNAGLMNMLGYVTLICLPIFLLWMVFSYVTQYLQNRYVNVMLQKLFGQMKKNQDYSDLLARVLIETEQQVKDGFMLGKFDLLVADMNELLAEIIHCTKIASNEQIERLWNKVQNGGKWSFGKVIIEINNAQPNFQMRIYEKACHDVVLAGTIMEFCARYLAVITMLEKHDREKVFLNIIETGVMGKVFSIFAPISDEVHKVRESGATFMQPTQKEFKVEKTQPAPKAVSTMSVLVEETPKKSLLNKINLFNKKKEIQTEEETKERDPFSVALERSFGIPEEETPRLRMSDNVSEDEGSSSPRLSAEDNSYISEPRFEIALPEEDAPNFGQARGASLMSHSNEERLAEEAQVNKAKNDETDKPVKAIIPETEEITATQRQLDNLKKEWAGQKSSAAEEKNVDDDSLAYPFGGWADEENYNK